MKILDKRTLLLRTVTTRMRTEPIFLFAHNEYAAPQKRRIQLTPIPIFPFTPKENAFIALHKQHMQIK